MFSVRSIIVAALVLPLSPAAAVSYTATALYLPSGSTLGAIGLGGDGTILGQARDTLLPVIRRPDGSLQNLPTLGGNRGSAQAINASGTIVGAGRTGNTVGTNRPYVRAADGTTTVIPIPAGDSLGVATAINDAGTVVGQYNTPSQHSQTFHWTAAGGTIAYATPAGLTDTYANAINASGVTGGFGFGDADQFVVRWAADGTASQLAAVGDGAYFGGLNDAGVIVGSSYHYDRGSGSALTRATVWAADGTPSDVGVFGNDILSELTDINNHGVAIGESSAAIDVFGAVSGTRLVTWTAAGGLQLVDFDFATLGLIATGTGSINDAGQFIANTYDPVGHRVVNVLLTPIAAPPPPAVPEPASWALLIAGFGLSGAMLRRRRFAGI